MSAFAWFLVGVLPYFSLFFFSVRSFCLDRILLFWDVLNADFTYSVSNLISNAFEAVIVLFPFIVVLAFTHTCFSFGIRAYRLVKKYVQEHPEDFGNGLA